MITNIIDHDNMHGHMYGFHTEDFSKHPQGINAILQLLRDRMLFHARPWPIVYV